MAALAQQAQLERPGKQVLLVVPDSWLRFRLQKELEQAGGRVFSLPKLEPEDIRAPAPFIFNNP